ncbi:hypothetical protein RND71_033068 [Anisodus tanguticus]|uniref:DDB1- and CUL4-associated factor 4 n=1 Tax=Anisodus tanguticus TaxID=243964 RepID=A0AAE1R8N9_9SOLA|nr:hypothetical protein RND71_033068 [Anisodus tanguticus]
MPEGLLETDILLTGGVNGSLSYLLEVGKAGQEFNQGVECVPDRVWPLKAGYGEGYCDSPGHVWRPPGACVHIPSNISCIKMSQKHPASISDASSKHVLITTLGAESYGGTVNILNLSEPLDLFIPTFRSRISEITSFEHTIWTADCSHDQKQAVVGTNRGANPGNGTILAIDTRQKPGDFSGRLPHNRIPCHPDGPSSRFKIFVRDSFQIKGKMHHRNAISMPSSVCCLASLRLYDQCFLASSMDGSIKLYDHRLIRGPIQSYEGNKNSHSRIQLGVDPSETIVMSGGVDCHLRLWSIKSGELLFDNKFMDTIPSVVRWPKTEGLLWVVLVSLGLGLALDMSKGSLGHAFTVRIRTGNQNQTSFYPSVLHEISVLVELILGHLCYLLTDVPSQPNSPPDNVFRLDRPAKQALGPKRGAMPRFRFTE